MSTPLTDTEIQTIADGADWCDRCGNGALADRLFDIANRFGWGDWSDARQDAAVDLLPNPKGERGTVSARRTPADLFRYIESGIPTDEPGPFEITMRITREGDRLVYSDWEVYDADAGEVEG